jgi:hypothetical protein
MMPRAFARVLPLVALLWVCMAAGTAHAGKGFMLITSGDEIRKVGDLVGEFKAEADAELGPGVEVGYMYEQFGLFFLEVWTWDGKYVLFRDDEYWEPTEDELKEIAGVSALEDLGKPWQYSFPPGLLVVVALVIGGIAFKLIAGKSDDDDDEAQDGQPAQA